MEVGHAFAPSETSHLIVVRVVWRSRGNDVAVSDRLGTARRNSTIRHRPDDDDLDQG
jgi:hypothetical protein